MARRQAAPVAPTYKTVDDVIACEVNGKHRVSPKMWPPPAVGLEKENPSLSMRCELCSTNVIVYKWHAEENEDIEVILPNARKATATA